MRSGIKLALIGALVTTSVARGQAVDSQGSALSEIQVASEVALKDLISKPSEAAQKILAQLQRLVDIQNQNEQTLEAKFKAAADAGQNLNELGPEEIKSVTWIRQILPISTYGLNDYEVYLFAKALVEGKPAPKQEFRVKDGPASLQEVWRNAQNFKGMGRTNDIPFVDLHSPNGFQEAIATYPERLARASAADPKNTSSYQPQIDKLMKDLYPPQDSQALKNTIEKLYSQFANQVRLENKGIFADEVMNLLSVVEIENVAKTYQTKLLENPPLGYTQAIDAIANTDLAELISRPYAVADPVIVGRSTTQFDKLIEEHATNEFHRAASQADADVVAATQAKLEADQAISTLRSRLYAELADVIAKDQKRIDDLTSVVKSNAPAPKAEADPKKIRAEMEAAAKIQATIDRAQKFARQSEMAEMIILETSAAAAQKSISFSKMYSSPFETVIQNSNGLTESEIKTMISQAFTELRGTLEPSISIFTRKIAPSTFATDSYDLERAVKGAKENVVKARRYAPPVGEVFDSGSAEKLLKFMKSEEGKKAINDAFNGDRRALRASQEAQGAGEKVRVEDAVRAGERVK
jgi:hypothetical protein